MARIVYGVSGEGSGHSSRAREMTQHLLQLGHEVRMVSYDRGYQNLKDDFEVFETEGLRIASTENKVSMVKTFTENISRLPRGYHKLRELKESLFQQFQPHCVISDFEPMTAYLANHERLPLITIDNQHRMRYMTYDYPEDLKVDCQITKNIIRAMVPRPDVSLVTTFFFGPTTNQRTFLFPPILRQAVLQQESRPGDHFLVYVTSGFDGLLKELKAYSQKSFRVYGYDRDHQEDGLTYKPFSRDGFLEDLATSKGVIATAGFTLISEAMYLRKPYLALPMQGQFEQQLNGYLLEQMGYGKNVRDINRDQIDLFFQDLPRYEQRYSAYEPTDNRAIQSKLAQLLDDDAALARDFHLNRHMEKE